MAIAPSTQAYMVSVLIGVYENIYTHIPKLLFIEYTGPANSSINLYEIPFQQTCCKYGNPGTEQHRNTFIPKQLLILSLFESEHLVNKDFMPWYAYTSAVAGFEQALIS